MALETYRTIRVVAGHANETIMPIRLSADDHDGRRILFELWDGAAVVASPGLSAKLLYTTADGTGGYTNLTTTTSNGTAAFVGPFPTEIFAQRRGALAVAVSSGQDVIATLRIPFECDEAIIDEDSPAAQDALSEFRAAVAQLDQLLPATTSRLGTVKVGSGLTAAGDGTLSVAPASLPSAVPIAKGGTGQTTAKAAQYALTNTAAEQTSAAADDTYVLTAHTSASAANGFVAKRKLSNLWTYIKSKIDGSAIAPASVNATGAVIGAGVSDSVGSLADLRSTVGQKVRRQGTTFYDVAIGGYQSGGYTYVYIDWFLTATDYYRFQVNVSSISASMLHFHDGTYDAVGRFTTTS